MKILFISPFLPYPPVAGGHRQIWTWLTRLAPNHQLAFAGFYEREFEAVNVTELAKLCVETRVSLRCPTPHAYHSFAQIPRWVSEYYSEKLAHDITQLTTSFRPEVVQFLHTNMAQYTRCVKGAGRVVTALDLAFVSHRRRLETTRGLEKLQARCEWLRMLRCETAAFSQADHVIAVSEKDAQAIRTVARHKRVTAVLPGVDREQMAPRARRPQPGRVLYLGHMEHYPNLDGLLFLYKEIWPQVRHAFPEARLVVAGSSAREELARVAPDTLARMEHDASVELAGFLPDLGAAMDESAAMAAPLRLGSGVRNKVIEAMAAGLPVVTTTTGAEGLAVAHNRELLIADDPAQFARELVRLFKNPELPDRLSTAAREVVARDHDNDRIAERLEMALMRAAGERA